jgi:hypothetical protein
MVDIVHKSCAEVWHHARLSTAAYAFIDCIAYF